MTNDDSKTPSDWDLVVVLPAVALKNAIEAGDTALVPHTDARYQQLIARRPRAGRLLRAFRTAFGQRLQPSIVVRRAHVERIAPEDLSGFRNMVALASVIKARTDRCRHRFSSGPVYSDLFEMYPVNLGIDGETVMVQSGTERGLDDDLRRFQGQPHPAYIYPENVGGRRCGDRIPGGPPPSGANNTAVRLRCHARVLAGIVRDHPA